MIQKGHRPRRYARTPAQGRRRTTDYPLMAPNFTLVLVLLTLLGAPLSPYARSGAHPASLRGKVLAARDGSPLPGATVRLLDSPRGTLTQSDGSFQFTDLPSGTYGVAVAYLGYAADTLTARVALDETPSLTFRLQPAAPELAAVDIRTAARDPHDLLQGVDLRLRPVQSAQDYLRLVPGLLTAQHAGGGKAEQIFLRGFDLDHGTDIAISVDGMPVNMVSHAHGQGYADLHFLIPETVEGIDVRKGPYNAADGNQATAGAVKRQTRNLNQAGNNPLGRVLKVALDNPTIDVEGLELRLGEAILKETPKFNSMLPLLKIIAVVAPLLGLLGTVTGMIVTFQAITLYGAGDPKLMAGGISTALVTTVLGLCVAIPTVFLHTLVASRARRLTQILQEEAAGILAERAEQTS